MSFRDYISNRQARGNPQGDFVRDAKLDPNLPDVESWAQLRAYLERNRACDGAIDAARSVWGSYVAKTRRSARSV
ncbi:hypothetical protein IC614_00245 [Allosphingosinicella flava]|uniref:YozE SAM-like domain-containing protein n=1 Tax=Allosphingosinicella flava TaxID=2771430 RepID=A0A7T2GJM2_9SPHN|nr:hypothetical protein IC614_00245 [Sphingosinicella flava]